MGVYNVIGQETATSVCVEPGVITLYGLIRKLPFDASSIKL